MARLGMKVAAFSYVGSDDWAGVIRRRLEGEGIDCSRLLTHPTAATSTTAVLIDPSGERSFAHCVGAPKLMDKAALPRTSRSVRPQPHDAGRLLLADAEPRRRSCRKFWPPSARPAARRRSTRPATAARCSRWTASCRTSTSTCPATTRPSIKPASTTRGRSSKPTASAARRACWA